MTKRAPFPRLRRLATLSTTTLVVLAASPVAFGATRLSAADSLPTVISNITDWIVGLLAGAATLFLTIGGLLYLLAGGDPGQVEKAKNALKSAAIGYCLAVLAPMLVSVLKGLVGA
jgi:hypothetical protein